MMSIHLTVTLSSTKDDDDWPMRVNEIIEMNDVMGNTLDHESNDDDEEEDEPVPPPIRGRTKAVVVRERFPR